MNQSHGPQAAPIMEEITQGHVCLCHHCMNTGYLNAEDYVFLALSHMLAVNVQMVSGEWDFSIGLNCNEVSVMQLLKPCFRPDTQCYTAMKKFLNIHGGNAFIPRGKHQVKKY